MEAGRPAMQAEQNTTLKNISHESAPAFPLLFSACAPLESSSFWTLSLAIAVSIWYCSRWWHRRQAFNLKDVMALLDIMSEPVILMSHHTISFVNNATLVTFGYDYKAELEGQHVSILIQDKEAVAHDPFDGRNDSTGKRRVIGKPRGELRHLPPAKQPMRFPPRLPAQP
jgi:hypothetical protein